MTTIAYNHNDRQIAWDSRQTSGEMIASDSVQKMQVRDGVAFWLEGAVSQQEDFIDFYFKGSTTQPLDEAFGLVHVLGSGELFRCGCENDNLWREPVIFSRAIGSGGAFALAAMDFGKSARDAVEYAKTRDIFTGGEVHVFSIE